MKLDVLESDAKWGFVESVPHVLVGVRVYNRPIFHGAQIKGSRVSAGIAGQADLYAIVPGGLHIEIETKSATAKVRKRQEAWREHCRLHAIPYMMPRARLGEDVEQVVQRWVRELRQLISDTLRTIETPAYRRGQWDRFLWS